MKKNSFSASLSTLGLGMGAVLAPLAADANNGIVFYEANNTNTSLGTMNLAQSVLGNNVFASGTLTPGFNQYSFGAVLFTATESGFFTFGQDYAPTDTIMMLFKGVFDPLNPGVGMLAGNDDTPSSIHRSILEQGPEYTIACSTSDYRSEWCPMIQKSVNAGDTYTLVVSHYNPSQSVDFALPLSFYSNGNPIFYEYSTNSPIDRRQAFYRSRDVGATVTPLFVGGTLQMDSGTTSDNNNYRLSNITSNTVNLNSNNVTFSGNFSDNNTAQPGTIRFINGQVALTGNNTHTGTTIVGSNANVIISADAQLGDASASVTMEGGKASITDTLSQERIIEISNSTASTIDIAANKIWNTAGLSGTGSLQKTGAGMLKLNGSQAFDGLVEVVGGSMQIYANGATTNSANANIGSTGELGVHANNAFAQINNAGTFAFYNANNNNVRVDVSNVYNQSANGTFYSDLATEGSNVLLQSNTANLAGNLLIDYFDGQAVAHTNWQTSSEVADTTPKVYTLINTTNGITGDFSNIRIDGTTVTGGRLKIEGIPDADYVEYVWTVGKTADQKSYNISGEYNLRWLMNDSTYQGQFTVNNGNTFTMDTSVLNDQTGSFAAWDGKSLTKKGSGTLVMATAQNYTGNTVVEAGKLLWGFENTGSPIDIQNHAGNYSVLGGASSGLSQTNTFLDIGGNLFLAGDSCTNADDPCFDLNNPLNVQNGNATRAELSIIPGGTSANRPEIIVDGQADIRGAYLNIQGLGATNPNEVFHSSSMGDSNARKYAMIHAKGGFKYSSVDGGNDLTAGFVNSQRPLFGIDYITGGVAEIVTCDPLGSDPCLYNSSSDISGVTQEYVLSNLVLAWTFTPVPGVYGNKTGNFTIAQNTKFDVDQILADQTGGTAPNPNNSSQLGFESIYGWWDGKTLTKDGAGTLYLSQTNTYTGITDIRGGTLSVADESNVGGSSLIQLGAASSQIAANLEFVASPTNTGGTGSNNGLGLNAGTFMSMSKDIVLANRSDNTITVRNATDSVALTGSLVSGSGNSYDPNTPMSGSSWIKAGAGTLSLAPQSGEQLAYQGDLWVQEGSLILRGDLSQITGDIYNEGSLMFDITQDTVWNGEVNNYSPIARAIAPSVAIKEGTGSLRLNGDSNTEWQINQGTLDIANSNFNSDVSLSSGAVLSFSQNTNNPITEATYTGKITADLNSTILMNRADSALNFNFSSDSTIGKVEVAKGQLNLQQYNVSPLTRAATVPRVTVDSMQGDNGGTISLYGKDTFLEITEGLNLLAGSKLEITLDPNNADVSKINAKNITIDQSGAGVEMDILGFAFNNDLGSLLDSGRTSAQILDSIFKSSQLDAALDFTVLASKNQIQGEFINQPLGEIVNRPSYLVYSNYVINDPSDPRFDPTSSHPYEYHIGDFGLAWLKGNTTLGNGTFDLARLTALNVNDVLNDRTESFDNWDGKSLTKTGDGLLVLSAVNGYTGKTTVTGGELLLATADSIAASEGVFMEDNAVLTLFNNEQTVQQLQSANTTAAIDLMQNGHLIIANTTGDSYFRGDITGGTLDGTDQSQLTIQQGRLTLEGRNLVDKVELGTGADLVLTGTKSRLFTNEITLDQNDITVDVDSRLRAFVHDAQGNSSITVKETGIWHMFNTSEIGTLNLDKGNVFFGNHAVEGAAGRTLTVGQWNATEGFLSLVTDLDAEQQPRLDTVVIKNGATGVTHVNLIDRGGFQPLLNLGDKILPIVSENGPGVLPTNAFDGGIVSGGYDYPLVYDTESGGFMIDVTRRGFSPDHQLKDDAISGVTQGSRSTAVSTLGNLGMLDFSTLQQAAACETGSVFGQTDGQVGRHDGIGQSKARTSEAHLQLGGDVAAHSMGEGCARYGILTGYNQETSRIDGVQADQSFGSIGKTETDSYYVGGYARYELGQDWYVNGAVVAAFDKTDILPNTSDKSQLDGQSTIATVEVGTYIPVDDSTRIIPSAQLLYQSTSFDDNTSTSGSHTYDRVNTAFARAGATLEHTIEDDVTLAVRAHAWHQFDSNMNVNNYASSGKLLNSIEHTVGDTSWADLQVGVSAKLSDAATLDFGMGYQGNFGSDSALTGRIGFNYRW